MQNPTLCFQSGGADDGDRAELVATVVNLEGQWVDIARGIAGLVQAVGGKEEFEEVEERAANGEVET